MSKDFHDEGIAKSLTPRFFETQCMYDLCVCGLFVCVAVDEQNNQTLTFESENIQHDNDDDDDITMISPVHLLTPARIPLSPVVSASPLHIPSSSSGYSSTTHGALFSPEELPTQSDHIPTSNDDLNIATVHTELSGISSSSSGISVQVDGMSTKPGEYCGTSTTPSGIPRELVGISTEPSGIPKEPDSIFSAPSGISSQPDGISTEPGAIPDEHSCILSTHSGISSQLGGISMDIAGTLSTHDGLPIATDQDTSGGTSDIPLPLLLQRQSIEQSSEHIRIPILSSSPPSSSAVAVAPNTLDIPVITTDLLLDDAAPTSPPTVTGTVGGLLPLTTSQPMASLAVPLSPYSASSDGDSSFCSTAGNSTSDISSLGILSPEDCHSPLFPGLSLLVYSLPVSLAIILGFLRGVMSSDVQ